MMAYTHAIPNPLIVEFHNFGQGKGASDVTFMILSGESNRNNMRQNIL